MRILHQHHAHFGLMDKRERFVNLHPVTQIEGIVSSYGFDSCRVSTKMDLVHTQQYRIPRHLHLLIPFPKSF